MFRADASWLIVISALILLSAGCDRRSGPVSVATLRAEEDPDQESWNPELFISEDGMRRIHMRARYMARYERPDSTFMILSGTEDAQERVHVELFDAEGDSSATVLADRILYFDREKRFVATGNVIVTTNENSRLESEHLAWNESERSITTPGFARYSTDKEVVTGFELRANEDLTEVRILRGGAVFTPEAE